MSDIAPEVTEADLRNAALVIKHLGMEQGSFLNPRDATVCADGALRLATYQRLQKLGGMFVDLPIGSAFVDDLLVDDGVAKPDLMDRYEAALRALLPLLPEYCTDALHQSGENGEESYFTCQANRHGRLERTARIHHYNDYVCTGGSDVAELFIEAAEKVRANA